MKWRRGHREEGSTCTLHLLRTSIWWCLKVLIGNIFSPFCLLLNLSQVYLTASLMSPGYGSHTVRSSYISPLFSLHSFPRDFLQLSSRVTSCPPHSCPHLHWGPLSLLFCVSSKCDRFQSCLVSPCSFPVVSFLPFNIHHFLFAPPHPNPFCPLPQLTSCSALSVSLPLFPFPKAPHHHHLLLSWSQGSLNNAHNYLVLSTESCLQRWQRVWSWKCVKWSNLKNYWSLVVLKENKRKYDFM